MNWKKMKIMYKSLTLPVMNEMKKNKATLLQKIASSYNKKNSKANSSLDNIIIKRPINHKNGD